MLDHRVLRSPARHPLIVPSRALGLAIAAEWEWQVTPAAAALACWQHRCQADE